ncbi:Hypothetical protein A7982_08981 [Minicystis rosea]|nr:Hypothetical protein A7982_08981 [Minicystis rosea]
MRSHKNPRLQATALRVSAEEMPQGAAAPSAVRESVPVFWPDRPISDTDDITEGLRARAASGPRHAWRSVKWTAGRFAEASRRARGKTAPRPSPISARRAGSRRAPPGAAATRPTRCRRAVRTQRCPRRIRSGASTRVTCSCR